MRKIITTSLIAACFVSLTGAGIAWARTVPGLRAQALTSANQPCLEYNFSDASVKNVCTGSITFLVGFDIDSAGSKSVSVTATSPTAGSNCRAVVTNPLGTVAQATLPVQIPVGSTKVTVTTAALNVPSPGVFFAFCTARPGAIFSGFEYTP